MIFPARLACDYKRFRIFRAARGVMSKFSKIFCRRTKLVSLGLGLIFSATAWSQQPASYSRSTAIDQANSRAEREAEQMVSLSADRIVSILRVEPGLLLQVKKTLVRKAFEQGRVLDPNDLTDDALFRLLREDDSIRVIATREIVDRSYIRALPTRDEVARNLPCKAMPTGAAAKQPDPSQDAKRGPTQEETYWAKHESDLDCELTRYLPYGTESSLNPPPQSTQAPSQQVSPFQYPQQRYPYQ